MGEILGELLGVEVGSMDGDEVGSEDGELLLLGAALGAGLLLGAALGTSVGQGMFCPFGEGVFEPSLQIPMCVMAVGPNIETSTFDTMRTSTISFLYDLGPSGATTNVRVELSESVTWIHTSFTTFNRPISTNSSTGVLKSNVIMPPILLAFGWLFPPVCCTINTLP